jgi:uncharacterized protein YukE
MTTRIAVSIGDIRRAHPPALREVASRLSSHAAILRDIATAATRLAPSADDWSGPASGSAGGRHTEIAVAAHTLGEGLQRCAQAIHAAAEQASDAARAVGHADRLAATVGARLRDDGVVVGVSAVATGADAGTVDEVRRIAERARGDYAATLLTLRSRLASTAARYAVSPDAGSHPGVLGAVTPLGLTGSFRLATWGKRVGPDLTEGLATNDGWPEITVFPPPDAPAAASAWFAALTGRERDWLISQRPDWVGPADGLPAWARDRANRIRLDQLTQQGAAELTALQEAELDSGERARRLGEVRAIVDGLAAVRALLATDDGRTRQLLSLDLQGQVLTAAVTTGDLDGAGHIPIFVPGFQADVAGDLARYSALVVPAADRADRLSRTAGDGRPVVGITWLGYAAPQVGQVLVPGRSVAGWGPANAGAPRLVQLLTGLDAAGRTAYPEDPPRLVLWGHSYGSLVAGLALRDATVPVAAAVVFGSPGMGVNSVAQLRLPPQRLFVQEALDDVVAATSRFGADPGLWSDATQLSVGEHLLPDGSPGTVARGHEEYLTPGSTSQWNLAAVAAGRTDLVVGLPPCPPWSPLSRKPPPVCERPLRIGWLPSPL